MSAAITNDSRTPSDPAVSSGAWLGIRSIEVKSMDDGRNVKCPRCWHWHGVIENFGHELSAVLSDGRNADKEKLCDRCQQIILADYPKHPSVPHIKSALEAQREKYARMPNS